MKGQHLDSVVVLELRLASENPDIPDSLGTVLDERYPACGSADPNNRSSDEVDESPSTSNQAR
jgi:hypothetical protein